MNNGEYHKNLLKSRSVFDISPDVLGQMQNNIYAKQVFENLPPWQRVFLKNIPFQSPCLQSLTMF